MSENKAVEIEEYQCHSVSGQTLKPVFIYSREEYFDTPQPSQKSHQVSTLCVPRESPNIVSMPKQLPSYVMSGEHAGSNAHLVRRRIDYQEVAEYRVVQPTGAVTTTTISARSLNTPGLRKSLSVRTDKSSLNNADERMSVSSSTSSSKTRRGSRVAAPTDRVLRSHDRKNGEQHTIFRDREMLDRFSSTPLGPASRQEAIRRRATEIEEAEEESTFHLSVAANTAPNRSKNSTGNNNTNASSSRPWHLSSMLGLSAEPTLRGRPLQVRDTQNYREQPGSIVSSSSFLSKAFGAISMMCRRLGSFLLNLIVIPLILLHCLYLAACAVGRATANSLSRFFQGITDSRGQSNIRSKNLFSFKSSTGGKQFTDHHGHRSYGNRVSPLFFGRCPSSCCVPLLLLLLLLSSILGGFVFRPASDSSDSPSEQAYFFGLLPSDAECLRLTEANAYTIGSNLKDLRWNCFSLVYVRPSVETVRQHFSAWWNWITGPFLGWFLPSIPSASEELSPPEATPENLDYLLRRLKNIDTRMADLRRQVAELKEFHSARVSAHDKEYAALITDVSQLQAMVVSLKEQIAALTDGVSGKAYDQLLIDELSKQVAFMSTASLDAQLQELRSRLEAIATVSPTVADTSTTRREIAQIESFEKALSELSMIVRTQSTNLEEKLNNLKVELETSKKEHGVSLKNIDSKISKEVTSAAEESQSNLESLESRLSFEIGRTSSRIDSLERLNNDLEQALKKVVAELTTLRESGSSKELEVPMVRVEELFTEMKASFYDQLTADLKHKVVEELSHSTESGSALQIKLLALIRATVDEKLREIFKDKAQITQTGSIPSFVLTYIDELLETFAADGTGKADFALESAGGTVVSTRCTRTYTSFKSAISIFGITLAYWSRSPNEILQPGNHPGECWCFHGSEGQAIVRLAVPVLVTGVSLEHIPKALAHTGRIDSAPRDFVIKALNSEFDPPHEGEVLGEFAYDELGKPIQYFAVKERAGGKPTRFVELAVKSNHGHPDYTCIYRLRVHGRLTDGDDQK